MKLRHGQWGSVFSATSYSCDNRALPGYCEATGAHLGMRCGIQHQGLEKDERCHAILVTCGFHPNKIHRDIDQEDRITR